MIEKKRIIIFGLLFIIIIIIIIIFLYSNKSNNLQKNADSNFQESKKIEEVLTYSRVNFFLTTQNKASLAIPDYWEGNYRIKEQGNEVSFYFVRGVSDEIKLFSILYREKDSFEINEGEELIGYKNNLEFIFTKSENKEIDGDIYYIITESINSVIKSFKIS